MRMLPLTTVLAALLASAALPGCTPAPQGVPAQTQSSAPTPTVTTPAPEPTPTVAFPTAMAGFSVDILKQLADGKKNVLVSPLSVSLALAMVANGASGPTLTQMEQVLGGGMPISDLNAALPGFVHGLPNTDGAKFHVANALWYNESNGTVVDKDFLATTAGTYDASAHGAPFDAQTVKDVNAWVKKNTDGMIPKIIDQLGPDQAMVLLNALAFDAKWARPYDEGRVRPGVFTDASGQKLNVVYLTSKENSYLDDGKAIGFTKPYDNNSYRFVALLPNPGVSVTDYVASLTGDTWLKTLGSAQETVVNATLPEFSFDYSSSIKDALSAMGMTDAFGPSADLSRMGTANGQPLFISDVLHKTFIDVTPVGTRAGAATAAMAGMGAAPAPEPKVVTLDRPFVFAIVDGKTNLPLFLGVVNTIAPK